MIRKGSHSKIMLEYAPNVFKVQVISLISITIPAYKYAGKIFLMKKLKRDIKNTTKALLCFLF